MVTRTLHEMFFMNWPDLNFDAFKSVDASSWHTIIEKELKGIDATWQAEKDLSLSPFIHRDDQVRAKKLPPKSIATQANDWLIAQQFNHNSDLLEGLKNGVGKVVVDFHSDTQLQQLLNDVYLNMIELSVVCDWYHAGTAATAIAKIAGPLHASEIQVSFNHDPLTQAFQQFDSQQAIASLSSLPASSGDVRAALPKARIINVEAFRFFEAGASHSLELAYALGAGRQYLDAFIRDGYSVDDAAPLIQFSLASDANYFVSIAKFRAFRLAWAAIIEGYNAQHDCSVICYVNAITSDRFYNNKELNNNIIRSTISTMSSIIGGADAVMNSTYNTLHDVDALRWARNIQHLLRDESGLDKVYDPSFGVGYIEYATDQVLEKVYSLLDDWSKVGAVTSKDGFEWLDKQLVDDRNQLLEDVNNQKTVLVGINRFLFDDQSMELKANHRLEPLSMLKKEAVQ